MLGSQFAAWLFVKVIDGTVRRTRPAESVPTLPTVTEFTSIMPGAMPPVPLTAKPGLLGRMGGVAPGSVGDAYEAMEGFNGANTWVPPALVTCVPGLTTPAPVDVENNALPARLFNILSVPTWKVLAGLVAWAANRAYVPCSCIRLPTPTHIIATSAARTAVIELITSSPGPRHVPRHQNR